MSGPIDRRRALGAIGTVGLAATIPLGSSLRAAASERLLLIDPDLAPAEARTAARAAAGAETQVLERDLVWQWRKSLGQRLNRGERATALVRWDKAIVLAGLARETGLAARQSRIAHSLFRVDIG